MSNSIYDIPLTTIGGQSTTLEPYRGKSILIVNVASQCGFTPQYEGLQKLYDQLAPRGLVVLGFPCNQFGSQEPGNDAEIQQFCSLKYNVTFPMFAKVDVNGANAHPLFQFLKEHKKGLFGTEFIKWNFTKFLVDPTGEVVERYAPTDTPEKIGKEIEAKVGLLTGN
jgi:glutathione peroxidase